MCMHNIRAEFLYKSFDFFISNTIIYRADAALHFWYFNRCNAKIHTQMVCILFVVVFTPNYQHGLKFRCHILG